MILSKCKILFTKRDMALAASFVKLICHNDKTMRHFLHASGPLNTRQLFLTVDRWTSALSEGHTFQARRSRKPAETLG